MIIDAYDLHILSELLLGTALPGGVAYHPNNINLPAGATQQQIADAVKIVDGFEQMSVSSDLPEILANGTAIATIVAIAGAGDTSIRFDFWDSTGDHAVINEVVAVAGGQAQYQFSTALAETYKIRAYGVTSLACNYMEVIANE